LPNVKVGIDARAVWRGLGIAQFVTNLTLELADRVEVVWFGDPALAPLDGEVVDLGRAPYPLLDLGVARRVARRVGVEVMHFTANTGWRVAGAPPFILTVHDLMFMDTPVRGRSVRQIVGHRYARRNVLRAIAAAHTVAAPSAASAAEIRDRGAPVRPPVVIPNGVDLTPPGDTVGGDHRDLETVYAVAFAGRDPRKGTELAVAGWRAAGWPAQLQLMGAAGLPPRLEEAIAGERARGEIVVHRYLDRPRLHEVLRGGVALIYPSRAEGFGLPVIEALAAGVPVITGLAPATVEVGGDAILRISAAEPEASIAAALRRLRDEPRLRSRLIAAGHAIAGRYSWRACADAYLDIYRSALG
jgi:glycosyltransferase involved in cell wall biosynthesis